MAVLILASASPRRKALLQQIGVKIDVRPVDIDEAVKANETAHDYVSRLATQKAQAGQAINGDSLPILGSDTSVVIDGDILGKPQSDEDARRMLRRLSGKQHQVFSGVCICHGARCDARVVETKVQFKQLSEDLIARYIETGEPMDKAGAYGIQGKGAILVESIAGSFSNVVGLPLETVADMLAEFNVPYWQ